MLGTADFSKQTASKIELVIGMALKWSKVCLKRVGEVQRRTKAGTDWAPSNYTLSVSMGI
jgi:hypothetical protein